MNKNKFITAYNELMRHLHETMDETIHSLADALEISKEKTRKTTDLTQDEIDQVSGYVKRDIEHAAHGLTEKKDSDSLSEWFKFDIELIENFALDAFLSLADKTRLELAKLNDWQNSTLITRATSQGLARLFAINAISKLPLNRPVKFPNARLVTVKLLSAFDIVGLGLIIRVLSI